MGVVCLIAATGCALAIPWTVKGAIDALAADPATAPLAVYVGGILALAAGNAAARLGSRFAIMGGAQRVEADIRNQLYASLQSATPAFFARYPTGELMARASSDVSAVKSLVGFGAVTLVGTTVAFVGAIASMLAVDPWLTVWAIAPYPVMILLARWFNVIVHERAQAAQERLGVLSSTVQERLAGMTVVRAYSMERQMEVEFDGANDAYVARTLSLARVQAAFTPLMGMIAGLGTLIVLWVGGGAVVDGRITLGALVAFNGYLAYLAWPTIALGWTLSMARRGLTSLERIREITDALPAADATPLPPPSTAPPPSIRFERLRFAYPGRETVLEEVTFEVPAGAMVAVVGPTGSGKSTLGLLLARLWEPPAGAIFVAGRDVTTLDRRRFRATLGYVPQEAFLFSRSLADNIVLGRTLAREPADGFHEAAAVAGIAADIATFAAGFDTVVGERGLTLSGGQRQRVALARALLARPSLLVLDDVFANVDAAKEEEIVTNLRRAARGRTVLLTTHRLRAAQVSDRIVVLAEGRVVEQGSHEELLAAGGLYARLWRIQQLEEESARV